MPHTFVAAIENGRFHGPGSLVGRSMNLSLRLGRQSANGSGGTMLRRLHGEGLAHNRAAVGVQLQLGHGTTTGRRLVTGRGGQSAQRGGRGRLEKRADGFGLAQDGVHGDSVGVFLVRVVVSREVSKSAARSAERAGRQQSTERVVDVDVKREARS